MFKLFLTWHTEFFNDFLWFSMTFPGKMPFFQVNMKFHDFSSQGLNSMTFPGLCEPCVCVRERETCLLDFYPGINVYAPPTRKTLNIYRPTPTPSVTPLFLAPLLSGTHCQPQPWSVPPPSLSRLSWPGSSGTNPPAHAHTPHPR